MVFRIRARNRHGNLNRAMLVTPLGRCLSARRLGSGLQPFAKNSHPNRSRVYHAAVGRTLFKLRALVRWFMAGLEPSALGAARCANLTSGASDGTIHHCSSTSAQTAAAFPARSLPLKTLQARTLSATLSPSTGPILTPAIIV